MILSHKYKFIFIKTNKTAGTSVEIALSGFCGEEDIITPISKDDEQLRSSLGYLGPQNHKGFYNHMSSLEIKNLVPEQTWNEYFKFCIERNPWDRFISFYYYINKRKPRPSFRDFANSDIIYRLKQNGYENYTIDDEIAVDKICLYEQLESDLAEVADTIGLPATLELPNAKNNFRKNKRHYSEILDTQTAGKISEIFKKEIELFNYTF